MFHKSYEKKRDVERKWMEILNIIGYWSFQRVRERK
jgi:hypothetical protein